MKKSKSEVEEIDLIALDTLGTYRKHICSFKDPHVKCFTITKFDKGTNTGFEFLMGTASDLHIMKL